MRFETPEQEIGKFKRRLERAGARRWPRDAQIVELFCGRGNGLAALGRLGFHRLEGVDLSQTLLEHYDGPAQCYLCDCRRLPFDERSRDIVIVHGGLHHLGLRDDLRRTIDEALRVLREGGLFVAFEPWMTAFLGLAHFASRSAVLRRMWHKLDTMAIMNEHERETYERWLAEPAQILDTLSRSFATVKCEIRFGKLLFVGRKPAELQQPVTPIAP